MFDIGGWEFLLIATLGIIIIGPRELPGAIRAVSIFVRRAREMAPEECQNSWRVTRFNGAC